MATRGSLSSSYWTGQITSYPSGALVQSQLFTSLPWVGRRQILQPENRSAPFVPGKFKMNPVELFTVTGEVLSSGPGVNIPKLPSPYTAYGERCFGDIVGSFIDTGITTRIPTCVDNDVKLAAINAEANLKEAKLDVGMMLAEAGETLKMLNSPLSELVNLTNDLWKKGDWMVRRSKRAMSLAKALGGLWMSYRYGWMPLANDISSIIKHYEESDTSNCTIERAAGSVTRGPKKYLVDTRKDNLPGNGYAYVGFFAEREYEEKVKYTSKIYFERSFTNPMSIYGLGPEQVPNLLWNAIPLSFVGDWFGSFGDWLLAITPTPGTKYLGWLCSAKTEQTIKTNVYGYRAVTAALNEGHYGSAIQTFEGLKRVTVSGTPGLPAWKHENLGWKRNLDSLFLTLQKLPRDLRRRWRV